MAKFNFDTEDKTIQGRTTEQQFVDAVLKRNPTSVVTKSTTQEDREEHFDFTVNGSRVDVKARKNIGILNAGESQDQYTVLELQDIVGKLGWVYGNADYIAFEIDYFFLICPRMDLVRYVENHVTDEYVTDLNDCVNKKYQRFSANDIITVVPFSDIQTKNTFIIKK